MYLPAREPDCGPALAVARARVSRRKLRPKGNGRFGRETPEPGGSVGNDDATPIGGDDPVTLIRRAP
jgi:hypothetical protein